MHRPWYHDPFSLIGAFLVGIVVVFGGLFALQVMYYRAHPHAGIRSEIQGQARGFTSSGQGEQKTVAISQQELFDGTAYVLGDQSAPVSIVAFIDYACPFSREWALAIRAVQLRRGGDVKFGVRDFPIDDVHPQARLAAIAARCAGLQGKYWAYHDKLFTHQDMLDRESLLRYADETGVNRADFSTCLQDPRTALAVDADVKLGQSLGVRGTPTLFINGVSVEGAIPAPVLEKIIDELPTLE